MKNTGNAATIVSFDEKLLLSDFGEQEDEIAAALITGDRVLVEQAIDDGIDAVSEEAGETPAPASGVAAQAGPAGERLAAPALSADAAAVEGGGAATGQGNDRILGVDIAVDALARAVGIASRQAVETLAGDDLVAGAALALGEEGAEAFGILNESLMATDEGADTVLGIATATGLFADPVAGGALAFGYAGIDPTRDAQAGSRLRTREGDDTITGIATAAGREDVGAFGLFFEDARTGGGRDRLFGSGTAEGEASTDARGIAVGISDVDDDTLEPPFGPAVTGTLRTGGGADRLEGEAILTVDAGAGDEVFFAGANGILVDGGAEAQWVGIVRANAAALAAAANQGREAVREILPGLLAQIETSSLDTGGGNDTVISRVSLTADQQGAVIDDDLEVIADAIENAGTMTLGAGNDSVDITLDIRSTIDGAKALGDPLDNASVGLITGYGAVATQVLGDMGLLDPGAAVEVEVNNNAVFDLGAGNDTITTNTFATAVDDLSAGDGLGNRGVWVGGNGSETLDLTTVSVFVLGEVEEGDALALFVVALLDL
ncbi:MAG: hypothetical protein AAFZ09_02910, partial [Pseudomonadota bacterium]